MKDEIVRCVCGKEESSEIDSIFIFCENCHCWQHSICMNISLCNYNDNTDYYCEECSPVNHPYWDAFTVKDAFRSNRGTTGGTSGGTKSGDRTNGGTSGASGGAGAASSSRQVGGSASVASAFQSNTTAALQQSNNTSAAAQKTAQKTGRKRNTLNSRLADEEDALLQQVLKNSILDVGMNATPLTDLTETEATMLNQGTAMLNQDQEQQQQLVPSPHRSNPSISKKSTALSSVSASLTNSKQRRKKVKSSNRQSSDIENDHSLTMPPSTTIPSTTINSTATTNNSIKATVKSEPISKEEYQPNFFHGTGPKDDSKPHVQAAAPASAKSHTLSITTNTKYTHAKKKIKKFSDMHKRVQQMLDYLLSHSLIPDPAIYTPTQSQSTPSPQSPPPLSASSSSQMHTLAECATALSIIDASTIAPLGEWEKKGPVLLDKSTSSDFHVPGLVHAALLRFQSHWEEY